MSDQDLRYICSLLGISDSFEVFVSSGKLTSPLYLLQPLLSGRFILYFDRLLPQIAVLCKNVSTGTWHLLPNLNNCNDIIYLFDMHLQSFRNPLKSLKDGAECYRGMTTIYIQLEVYVQFAILR